MPAALDISQRTASGVTSEMERKFLLFKFSSRMPQYITKTGIFNRVCFPSFDTVGFTLALVAAGLLAIYYAAYVYYSRKLGGED
jgi:hypothetical protein